MLSLIILSIETFFFQIALYEGDMKDNELSGKGHDIWTGERELKGQWNDNKMYGAL